MSENKQLCLKQQESLFSKSFLNLVPLVCSLLVVLIHQYNIKDSTAMNVPARVVGFFSHGICTVAVPMFFFMSGYLFYRNLSSVQDVFLKQKKRVISVLLPFLAWSAAYYIFFAVLSKVLPSELQKAVDLSLFGVIKGIVFYEYVFPMWYMFQLCVYILLAPTLYYLLKNRIFSVGVLIVSTVLGLFVLPSIEINVGGYGRALFHFNFFAYYFAGCIAAKEVPITQGIKALVCKMPLILSVILFLLFGFVESLFFDEVIASFNNRCLVPLAFASFMVMMLKICDKVEHFPPSPVSTMVIYGVHSLVGLLLSKTIFSLLHMAVVPQFLLSFVLVTVTSFAVGFLLKWIKPLYRVFSGNR